MQRGVIETCTSKGRGGTLCTSGICSVEYCKLRYLNQKPIVKFCRFSPFKALLLVESATFPGGIRCHLDGSSCSSSHVLLLEFPVCDGPEYCDPHSNAVQFYTFQRTTCGCGSQIRRCRRPRWCWDSCPFFNDSRSDGDKRVRNLSSEACAEPQARHKA